MANEAKTPVSAANLKAVKRYLVSAPDGSAPSITTEVPSQGVAPGTYSYITSINYDQPNNATSKIKFSSAGWARIQDDPNNENYYYIGGGIKIGDMCYAQLIANAYYARVTKFATIKSWTPSSTEKSSHTFYGSIQIPIQFDIGGIIFNHILSNCSISFAKSLASSNTQSYICGSVYQIESNTNSNYWTCHYGCYDPQLTNSTSTTVPYYVTLDTYFYSDSLSEDKVS